jgi:hypothetical protein
MIIYESYNQAIPSGFVVFDSDMMVAGINHRVKEALTFVKAKNLWLEFERDYTNPSDSNAIKIIGCSKALLGGIERHFIGFVPRGIAKYISQSKFYDKVQPILSNILANDYTFAFFYEASSAIVKAGLCQEYGKSLELLSLSIQTSYFVSNSKLDDFMGRRFDIVKAFAFSKKSLKEYLKTNNIIKASVSRNQFPVSPEEIKKQFQIRDGGDEYLFFTSQSNGEKLVLHCRKI